MVGKTVTMKFKNGTTAIVRIKEIKQYNMFPNDYWLEYMEGETNKLLVHPDYGKNDLIKSEILLPEVLVFNTDVIEFDYFFLVRWRNMVDAMVRVHTIHGGCCWFDPSPDYTFRNKQRIVFPIR